MQSYLPIPRKSPIFTGTTVSTALLTLETGLVRSVSMVSLYIRPAQLDMTNVEWFPANLARYLLGAVYLAR